MDNKQIFLEAFGRFATGDIDGLASVLREDFIEHSPSTPSGRDAWLAWLKENATGRIELRRVIGDEEYVVAHYHLVTEDGTDGLAVADIWRFEDGLITEHWDVVQPVPDASLTPNGMF